MGGLNDHKIEGWGSEVTLQFCAHGEALLINIMCECMKKSL